jgi:hypothetical protein
MDLVQIEKHHRHSSSHHGGKHRSRFRRLKKLQRLTPQVVVFIAVMVLSYFVWRWLVSQ